MDYSKGGSYEDLKELVCNFETLTVGAAGLVFETVGLMDNYETFIASNNLRYTDRNVIYKQRFGEDIPLHSFVGISIKDASEALGRVESEYAKNWRSVLHLGGALHADKHGRFVMNGQTYTYDKAERMLHCKTVIDGAKRMLESRTVSFVKERQRKGDTNFHLAKGMAANKGSPSSLRVRVE